MKVNFKLSLEDAFKLIWDACIGEDEENFTPEYRKAVMDALKEVRELEEAK